MHHELESVRSEDVVRVFGWRRSGTTLGRVIILHENMEPEQREPKILLIY